MYCLPGVTPKVIPIYRFLYTVFSVLPTRCHKKGLLIYRLLYMDFYSILYQVLHKKSYQSTGSFIRVFSVLSTRCHTKGPPNLQVLIYGTLVYCQPCVTQNVLPIYRFLYMGFYCIVYQVSRKRSYQSTGSYIYVFNILSTRCHTKGPTNLQVLINGF